MTDPCRVYTAPWPSSCSSRSASSAASIAGALTRKIFDQIWGLFDDEEPPDGKHRDIEWGKLVLAAAAYRVPSSG